MKKEENQETIRCKLMENYTWTILF